MKNIERDILVRSNGISGGNEEGLEDVSAVDNLCGPSLDSGSQSIPPKRKKMNKEGTVFVRNDRRLPFTSRIARENSEALLIEHCGHMKKALWSHINSEQELGKVALKK